MSCRQRTLKIDKSSQTRVNVIKFLLVPDTETMVERLSVEIFFLNSQILEGKAMSAQDLDHPSG